MLFNQNIITPRKYSLLHVEKKQHSHANQVNEKKWNVNVSANIKCLNFTIKTLHPRKKWTKNETNRTHNTIYTYVHYTAQIVAWVKDLFFFS